MSNLVYRSLDIANLMKPFIVLTGPNSVGKTLYVDKILTQISQAEIVNLDSYQVYAFFRIGTGRGDGNHERRHLYGFASPFEKISPQEYVGKARAVAYELRIRGKIPIFEGGSRSYLPALLQEIPLKIFGLYPPPNDCQWIEDRITQRIHHDFRQGFEQEIRLGERLGYGDTEIMQHPILYRPTRDYLAGKITKEEAIQISVQGMLEMHRDQLEKLSLLPVTWLPVADPQTADKLLELIQASLD